MDPSDVGLVPYELRIVTWDGIANLENETRPNTKAQPRVESGRVLFFEEDWLLALCVEGAKFG
jgi:hypothetical protein